MAKAENQSRLQDLRWYLGTESVEKEAEMVMAGGPIAILGRPDDDVVGFADRLAPERPVLDLTDGSRPSANKLARLFSAQPDAFVLAPRVVDVAERIGLVAQPWYMAVMPLSRRRDQTISLLRAAIVDLGVMVPLEQIGRQNIERLAEYDWPHGLRELRAAAGRLAALLQEGNLSAASRKLAVSRQALSKYIKRRLPSHAAG
jgi:hypothetical protein